MRIFIGAVSRVINSKIFVAAVMFILLLFGFCLRSYRLPTILNGENWDIGNAIRLHYLPFFNFGDTARFNFFKSFLMGTHGIADFLFWYLITGLYDLLHIPISEHNIYLSQVVLGMFLISFLSFFIFHLFEKNRYAVVFVMLFGVFNFDHIIMSRTHWYCNSINLLELFTYAVIFFWDGARKKIIWHIFLGGLMFLNALTPNIVILPMVILLQYLLYLEKQKLTFFNSAKGFLRSRLSFWELIVWVPFVFGLVIDYFAQKTIGVSGLGLFGQITHHYGFNPSANIIKGLASAKSHFTLNPDYFYNILWIFSVIAGVFYLVRGKLGNVGKRYLFFIVLFLYHFGMEIFFGRFYVYDIFVPITVLGGVGLYCALDNINKISINNKLRKIVYCSLVSIILVFILIISADRINLASRRNKGANLIPLVPSFNDTTFDSYYNRVNPLKTIGYYLRKCASKTDKIYTLFGGDAWTGNTEYYFGKKAMATERGTYKQIYNNVYSLEFYKERDGVDVFDYYVVIESFGYDDNYSNILSNAQKKGVKKIADITYGGKVYASIYSPKDIQYEIMRMEDYDKKWDKEYANLKNIYENKLVGLVSLWGLY